MKVHIVGQHRREKQGCVTQEHGGSIDRALFCNLLPCITLSVLSPSAEHSALFKITATTQPRQKNSMCQDLTSPPDFTSLIVSERVVHTIRSEVIRC